MAGIDMPKTPQHIDGVSFMPLLTDVGADPSLHRPLYWNFPNNWGPTGPGIGATCTIRNGDWKLIYYYETANYQLYNIKQDIGEQHNLAAQHPEIKAELAQQLARYLRSVNAQRPVFKATSRPAPWPDGK